MNSQSQINIEEKFTAYDIQLTYHSDSKCENYDVKITGIELPNNKVTIKPGNTFFSEDGFRFIESDPDRVIAIAQMMIAFAKMAKNDQQICNKAIDNNAQG